MDRPPRWSPWALAHLAAPVDPKLYHRDGAATGPTLRLTWLGTAGFVLEIADRVLVLDPFVSRPGLRQTVTKRLRADPARVRRFVPRADDVLIGHAHHDHILDAPTLCRQTGARLIGAPAAAHVARAAGLPDAQIRVTTGGEDIACGAVTVRALPSRHGRVYFNRVTLAGDITAPPPWPPRVWDLRHGQVLNWFVQAAGLRIVHIDSADFISAELVGRRADVLCLCAIGRKWRPRYVEEAVGLLRPRFVVACHWDWFFSPLDETPRCLPGVDLPGFVREIAATGATPVVLPFLGRLGVDP